MGWTRASTGSTCVETNGRYDSFGIPAPNNVFANLRLWPVTGSLATIVESGANSAPPRIARSVDVRVEETGHSTFTAFDREGATVSLAPREWRCENGALTSRRALRAEQADAGKEFDEVYVRLWQAADGALIAEHTIRTVTPNARRSSRLVRPLAKLFFRFAPAPTPG
jgi:hypothetical protein